MEQITLQLSDSDGISAGKHKFTGELLATCRYEENTLQRGTLHRKMFHLMLYKLPNESFLLYHESHVVGCGWFARTIREFASINDILRSLTTRIGDRLINSLLDGVAVKEVAVKS